MLLILFEGDWVLLGGLNVLVRNDSTLTLTILTTTKI